MGGQLTFNNSYAMIDAAVNGFGIAYVPENIAGQSIASGKLIQILEDWSLYSMGISSIIPAVVRIFLHSKSLSMRFGIAVRPNMREESAVLTVSHF